MSKAQQEYNQDSIQVLEELEAVRKRPGMYIGSTDSRGLHHLVWEIVDNAIDEVLADYASLITVTIKQDNSIVVFDNGRGIPVGMHKTGRSAAELIFLKLHAGGKFGQSGAYKVSGGLHGVGASVCNALCEFLDVTINKNKKVYHMRFENGGKLIEPLNEIGTTNRTGTTVWFKPDSEIFSTTVYVYKTLAERLRESAFLIKGLKIVLIDERNKQKESFYYEDGIKEYVKYLNEGKKAIHDVHFFNGEIDGIAVDIAFQYTKSYNDTILSFVNNVRTKDGGTHETGFKSGLTKICNDYARKNNLIKDKAKNLDGADIREGITTVLSLRIMEDKLQFEGQTKNKLGSPEARSIVENIVVEQMNYFFSENANISFLIIDKAIKAQFARDAARKAREEARLEKKKNKKDINLSGKLSPAQSKNPEINELYIVEGDSAGGSAKQGRNRKFQAILPLRGKVLNAEKSKAEDVLKNVEINTIIHTIGAGLGQDFDLGKSNYQKVIIMTDADTDGAHIQVLLLTFFFRYMRELVMAGRLYIAQPPLYKLTRKVRKKDDITYAWNDEELQTYSKKYKNFTIQRFKGLGEMNSDQLWETTMNPESRTLIRVNIDDLADADQRIRILMGDAVEPRRDWLENNVSFSNEDNFVIKE